MVPLVGLTTATDAYSDADTLLVNNAVGTGTLPRLVGGFDCTAANKASSLAQGGCVPANTRWGYAIRGPAYAGIGPPVELRGLSSASEPGLGRSVPFTATAVVQGLTKGARYKLYCLTSLAAVPTSAAGTVGGTPLATWTATAAEYSLPVTFKSGSVAYYIAVKA